MRYNNRCVIKKTQAVAGRPYPLLQQGSLHRQARPSALLEAAMYVYENSSTDCNAVYSHPFMSCNGLV
jgi:hypothetical protein